MSTTISKPYVSEDLHPRNAAIDVAALVLKDLEEITISLSIREAWKSIKDTVVLSIVAGKVDVRGDFSYNKILVQTEIQYQANVNIFIAKLKEYYKVNVLEIEKLQKVACNIR